MSLFIRKIEKADNGRKVTPSSLILTGVSLVISLVLLGTSASVAWFSLNRQVDSDGMTITADVSPNLIISDDLSELQAATSADAGTMILTSDTSGKKSLIPATHYKANTYHSDATNYVTDPTTNLVYNTNPSSVSSTTGQVKTSRTLLFADAVNATGKTYYFDYVVYIASLDKPLEISTLTAQIEIVDDPEIDAYDATSIDFYVYESEEASEADGVITIDAENYVGTLNLAGVEYTNSGTAKTSIVLSDDDTVPVNSGTGAGYLQVIMRIYLDGNLQKAGGIKNYINSAEISVVDLGLKVSFTANEPTA